MGNDPANGVDPDGGFKWWGGAFLNKLLFGGDGIGKDKATGEWYVSTNSFETYSGITSTRRFSNVDRSVMIGQCTLVR